MRLAIIGSRTCNVTPSELEAHIHAAGFETPSAIVSGGAAGIDTCAAEYARLNAIELVELRPDWKKFGRAAGQIRNRDIIAAADCILAIWDGVSKGTEGGIKIAKKAGKKIFVKIVK